MFCNFSFITSERSQVLACSRHVERGKNNSAFIKKLIQIIISKGKNHSIFKSTFYLFDIADSDTFRLGDSNRHMFKFYSVIRSVKFES